MPPPTDNPAPANQSHMVIISNRLPVHRVTCADGNDAWETSPGGLVSALTPILTKHPSTWIGWLGQPGDAPGAFDHDGIHQHPVALNADEIEAFYEGFSNRTIWPLYHDCVRPPEYHRHWWRPYVAVNKRFAEAAAAVAAPGGIIWIHDYHLQLAPAMVRQLRPDVRIGFFLHIPFPPQELFAQLPWRKQVLEGLLGADVVGFQTRNGAANFAALARRYAGAGGQDQIIEFDNRKITAGPFPISIDCKHFADLAADPDVRGRTETFRDRLGRERRIILGVDRMDYTKGIDIRLQAYHELLRSGTLDPKRVVFVQVAVPSRERVQEYQELRERVERLVGEINGEYGELGRTPVHYFHRNVQPDELVALYRAADVMLVTPLRDGMNLVAKEYCMTRLDDTGVLVLSEFTGSARQLTDALLVNPHDIDGLASTIFQALQMPEAEQSSRMKALRETISNNDVFAWANAFLESLAA